MKKPTLKQRRARKKFGSVHKLFFTTKDKWGRKIASQDLYAKTTLR